MRHTKLAICALAVLTGDPDARRPTPTRPARPHRHPSTSRTGDPLMHAFTSHSDGARRYFANFDLTTHPLCWLRGHRAKAEVIDAKYSDPWVLITCRTCGARHTDPYLSHGKIGKGDAREVARQVAAARDNNAAYASARDGRNGFRHHRLELSLEVVGDTFRKPGLHLHIGDRWSETPLDGSVHGRKRAAYFSVGGVGNRLAHWLTKGEKRDVRIGAGYKADR